MQYTLTGQMFALDLLFAFAFWYSVGYDSEKLRLFRFNSAVPLAVRVIVKISFGAAISLPILFLLWILGAPLLTFTIFYMVSAGSMMWLIMKKGVSFRKTVKATFKEIKYDDLALLAMAVFLVWLLGQAITFSNWPPAGDAMWAHGPLVSLIASLQRVPGSWAPLAVEPINYPLGFHTTVAAFNLGWNILPGQAVFVFAATTLILAVLLLSSLIQLVTSSTFLALVGGVSSLYVSSAGRLELWLFGYFYNGPYPNLYAFSLLLLGVILLVDRKMGHSVLNDHSLLVSELVLTSCLVMVYPAFAFYAGLFAAMVLMKGRKTFLNRPSVKKKVIFPVLLPSLVIAVSLFSLGSWNFTGTTNYLLNHGQGYYISSSQLLDGFSGILISLALAISIARLLTEKLPDLPFVFLIIFILVAISTYPDLYHYVSPILPNRSYIFLYLLSIVITLDFARTIRSFLPQSTFFMHRGASLIVPGLVCAMLIISVAPSVWYLASGTADRDYLWFPASQQFRNDFSAMIWIRQNVPANQLILNDLSFSSEFLSSIATLNVVFSPVNINANFSGSRLFEFWTKPMLTLSDQDLITRSSVNATWSLKTSWGQGNIGTPQLVQLYPGSLAVNVLVPAGQNRFWGVSAVLNKTIDLRPYLFLKPSVFSSSSLGLSLLIEDNSNDSARYDFVSDSSSIINIQLDKPSGSQGILNISSVVRFTFLTGYVGPFPSPNETVQIKGFGFSEPNPGLKILLRDFDVRYVFVTSEWGMYTGTAVGGNDVYVPKPYTPTVYNIILSRLGILTSAFVSGDSVVYRVQF